MRTLSLLLLAACVDLPEGWEDARPVSALVQEDCGESPYDTGFREDATATVVTNAIEVVYDPVHFRCAQDVVGFTKAQGDLVEVLLQPADMHPAIVAGCDCGYRVEVRVPDGGATRVRAWRRWDDLNDDNVPVEIADLTLTR